MKNNKLLKFYILSLLLMLSSVVHADYYQKVTSTNDIVNGDYLIVCETSNVVFNGALDPLDAASNTVACTITNQKIESSTDIDAAVFTLDVSNGTIKSASNKYIGVVSNSNGLKTSDQAATYKNSFSIDNDGNAVIAAVFDESIMSLRYNSTSNQARFRYYKDAGQQPIQLYKKVIEAGDTRVATTLTFGDHATSGNVLGSMPVPSVTVSTDNATVSNPVITWTSSDETVATITNGTINFLKAGLTTITATYAGDNTNYKGSSATFDLIVKGTIEDGIFDFSIFNDYGSGVEKSSVKVQETSTWTAGNVKMSVVGRYCWFTDNKSLRLYANNAGDEEPSNAGTMTLSLTNSNDVIAKIEFSGSTLGGLEVSDGTYANNTWTGSAKTVTFTANGSNTATINTITVTYYNESMKETTITFSEGYATFGLVGNQLTLPTPVIKDNDNQVINGTVNWSSSDEEVAAIENGKLTLKKVGTATITAGFTGDGSNRPSDASYKVRIAENAISSLQALQQAVTSTSTPVIITFNNVLVTATESSNVWLTDNDGYGALIYYKNHGLTSGKILNGTIFSYMKLYNGYAELTSFTPENLTITEGTVTAKEKTIDAITTANQGMLVTLKNVTYQDEAKQFSDGNNTIAYYDAFSVTPTLVDGQNYDITGIVCLYKKDDNIIIQISPRTTEDIQAVSAPEPAGFRDIKIDFTQHAELATGSNVYITVAADGTIGTIDDATKAAATIKANAHGSYGTSNFTASVPVEGCVKITYATHDFGNDITVTNANGDEVAKLNTMGEKWMSNHDNVVVAYYRTNEPTTLNFSNANYNPYFAVEAIDEADLPAEITNYNVTFAAGDGTGVAPAALEVAAGSKFQAPKNYTLYKEGATLTGWSDGTTTYTPGTEITPAADMTLTAVFTNNEVSLADRTAAVTLNYVLSGYDDNPKYAFEGNKGIMVTQATIGDKTIDVKVDVDATGGKFAHNGSGWHQVNTGTKVTVPSCKDATFAVKTYQNANGLKFGETEATAEADPATYTATTNDATLVIEQTANGYWNNLTITLPVASGDNPGEEPVAFQDFEITNEQLSGSFDASTLPAGVTFNGTQRNDNHGYGNVTLTVPVTGKVTFTIGGCQYANPATCKITNAAGELLAEPNLKTTNCYHQTGEPIETRTVTYVYKGEPTTLTFSNIAYLPYFKAEGEKVKEKITLDNEAVTATFPFNEGTEGQKATFSNDDYFLTSKVTHGSNWSIQDKITYAGTTETRLAPAAQHNDNLTEDDVIRFLINPKPGFTFTPTKVSFKANRFGTDNGLIDVYWQNADGTTVELEKSISPERNNTDKNTEKSYDLTGATAGEGVCGLKLFLYKLQSGKQIGLADIIIEGTLTGTEKDVPVLASFKLNGNQFDVEDVFGDAYEATLELPKAQQMVSATNPLTDVTAKSGEIGTITYDNKNNACTVTIPMTAGETAMDYVLNVVFKPDFTLSYLDVEGNVLKTQLVEKDATIGAFAYDINDVAATKDGYKARGWFKTGVVGEKYTTADVITADTKLYTVQTPIEVVSTHEKYSFDLTSKLFYAEDHEAFVPSGDKFYWHDAQHGWAFSGNNKIDLLVGPKAVITVTLCRYGSADDITITEGETQIGTLPGKNNTDTDGEIVAFNYEGAGGTITLNLSTSGEMYIHGVKISNLAEVNYDSDGQWYFVKAGDAGSFLDVLDVVNGKNAAADAERAFIFLPDGTYDLDATVKTAISGKNISIIGQSMDKTIIVTKPDKSIEGLGSADMFQASTQNLYLQDLTLKNALDYYSAGSAGRAAVLQDAGTRTIGKNVRMLSYQDTYYSSNSSQQAYWENCDIHGTVDFICGGGDIRFQNTTITLEKRALDGKGGRTITAPTTNTQFGYVFEGCTVVDLSEGKGDWNFGRTWQNEPICVYLNTTLDEVAAKTIVGSRWTQKGMNNKDPKLFGEFGTKDVNGSFITPASNKITSFGGTFETILTAQKAAEFSYEKMFTDWDPKSLASQVAAPSATYENGAVTFAIANNGMIGAAIFKNDVFAGISLNGTFNIAADSENDVLTIRGINQMGGFGPAATVITATGISTVKTDSDAKSIYTLQGVRVNNAQKGVYIINGKKTVIK